MPQERTNVDAQRIADRERWSFLVAKDQVVIPRRHRLPKVVVLPAAGALAVLWASCGSGAKAGQPGDVVAAEPGAMATAQAAAQATEVTGIIATQTATAKDKASPTASSSPEPPKPTVEAISNEQGLNDLNSLINLIQTPNPVLLAACNPQPHLLKQDQELIVYGNRELPDPNRYQDQKFTKPGLVDVKASLEQGDKVKASEQLKTLWRQMMTPIGCFDTSGRPDTTKDEFVRWKTEDIDRFDPKRQFIPPTAKLDIVSEIKQEAVKQFLKLWYGLASANPK